MNADGRKKNIYPTAIVLTWPRPPPLPSANWLNAHEQKFCSFLFGDFPISFFFSSRHFLRLATYVFFFLSMLVTDGHMCQNWHRWEEWWRPSTVTWERKTIRIQCVRWTCYAIRQTKRVKGTWQIFDLNEEKKEKRKSNWTHRATGDITSDREIFH